MYRILLLLLFLLIGTQTSAEDTLRCGSKIVTTALTMADVRKYCGEPSSVDVEEHDVRAGNRVVGKTQLNIWRYNRASGQRTAILEFDQEKLLSITYESK